MPAPTIIPNTIHSPAPDPWLSVACSPAPSAVNPVPAHIAGWNMPKRETVQPTKIPANMLQKMSGKSCTPARTGVLPWTCRHRDRNPVSSGPERENYALGVLTLWKKIGI